jgi:CRISPR-associated protein Cst2
MAFLSGVFLIDCPASALNNSGKFPWLPLDGLPSNHDNWVAVKKVHTKQGTFPYVSAQAFRSWLRESLKGVEGWKPSPVFREEKVAYTDADPIEYAEDDLFGYMRAPGGVKQPVLDAKEQAWKEKGLRVQEWSKDKDKVNFVALTRSSPFRVSTLVSVAPVELGRDYGNMSRQEGDPVPFEHEFYRTALLGVFSLDLGMVGRFYHVNRTGYRHLDAVLKAVAEKNGLQAYDNGRAFELTLEERKRRVKQLLEGLAQICGGAKLALHYTDVTPRFILMGVSRGGNHLFATTVTSGSKGDPVVHLEALKEADRVYKSTLLSRFYAGLAQGYLDSQRGGVEGTLQIIAGKKDGDEAAVTESGTVPPVPAPVLVHPVEAIRAVIQDLDQKAGEWLA